jgi:sugar phosphate isomerase/epimerase
MNNPVALLASYWTIAGGALPHTDHEYSPFDFRDRVEAAAKAGFKGFGIWHADLDHILETRSLAEMKLIFEDNGIENVELEFLTDWFLEGERKQHSDRQRQKLLRAAEVLGATHVKVGDFFQEPYSMPRLIEAFAELCAEGANHGTRIGFELMPFSMLQTLADTVTMVQGAGAANGGISLDLWHVVKLGVPYDEVGRLPLNFIVSVELNDGTLAAPWSLHEDTINHRRLCGEGEFDIKSFIACVQQTGYRGPWGIEVLSEELRTWSLSDLTTRAFNTTNAQFGEAET